MSNVIVSEAERSVLGFDYIRRRSRSHWSLGSQWFDSDSTYGGCQWFPKSVLPCFWVKIVLRWLLWWCGCSTRREFLEVKRIVCLDEKSATDTRQCYSLWSRVLSTCSSHSYIANLCIPETCNSIHSLQRLFLNGTCILFRSPLYRWP